MRLGLLADTHIRVAGKALPLEVMEAFQGVDLILHAGDIYIPSVLDDLQDIAPVLAARGDDDYGDVLQDQRVKEKHVLELEGKTLWLMHHRPFSLLDGSWRGSHSSTEDDHSRPDIVVFGHEHYTVVKHYGATLLVNSGSPTFLDYRWGLGTVGILTIEPSKVAAHILELSKIT